MANLTPPAAGGAGWECPTPGLYNAIVMGVEETPNSFYKPGEDNPNKATQLKWTIKLAGNEEFDGTEINIYTSSYLSRHEKAKLPKFLDVVDPDFSIDVGYKDLSDLEARTKYSKLSVLVEQKKVQVTNDSGEVENRTYPRITSFLKSREPGKMIPEPVDTAADIPF